MKKLLLFISLIASYSAISQEYLMQNGTVNTCSGTFYDSGGSGGNYSNNESLVFTICPDNPGQLIQLDFTQWNTQLNADIMTIYNGPDTASPAFGQFSGGAAQSPGFVTATAANTSGCLTIEFISDTAATTTGWAADISCFEPCQGIVSVLDSTTPAPNADGYIRVCPDEEITLTGSGQFEVDGTGATYEWTDQTGTLLGTGTTATFSYPDPGVYIVNLTITDTNPEGCTNTNLINQVVQVATEPDFTGTAAAQSTICFGDSTTIEGVVAPVDFINDCTPPVSGTTFLPDGSGASYETCITVDCYESSQTLDDISQLIEICVNMEHSYLGDLDIFITSPNGQTATLKSFGAGGGGTYLGGANDDGTTTPGVGAEYCFSMSGTVILVNGPTIIAGNPPGNSIAPGTYLPEESFAALLGSPLNGDWCIEIVDNLSIDNGYIFEWGMSFDPAIQPPELSFTPVITSESWDADPSITNTAGNTITVEPPTAGNFCYTYRVTDDFGCEYTEVVCIDVLPEVVNDPPIDLFVCDGGVPPYIFDLTQNDGVVLASNPNPGDFVVTYHLSQADADNNVNSIGTSGAYSGTDGEVIYVRIEYLTSGCYETSSFTLNVAGLPVFNPAPDMETCDDASNDGVEPFDLTTQSAAILGAQDPAVYEVLYFTNFADADAGTNALVSPYTNVINPEPIYVRVQSIGDADCYIASPAPVFNLIVNPLATATQPADMVVCDDVSNDGVALFDLDTQTATVLGAQNAADFTVTYHESQADADAGINALVSPYANITNPQTIYVRVEENTNSTCYGTTTFDLVVNLLPEVVPVTPLAVCDDDNDGFAEFTLTDKDGEVLNGQTGITVTYHISQADADAGINALASPYMNVSNPQIIYVRLEDTTSGCYNTTFLGLIVNPIPNAITPAPLEACDDDNDGFTQFDLTLKDAEVTGGAFGVAVSWHETLADAQNDLNPIASPYNNIVPNIQTVYARAYNVNSGCFDVVELVLIVNPLPAISAVTPYELCDDNNAGDEIELFTLSTKIAEIQNGQAGTTVTFYESLADGQAQVNQLNAAAYLNISNPQTIWYVIEDNLTLCSDIGTFELIVNPLPILIPPTPLEVCDDPVADGFTAIDLSVKDDEIRGGNPNYAVTYYLTQADADAGINQLPIPYTNISNPQTIYARGEDINTGCHSTVTLDLIVEQAPIANVPTPLEYCDPDSDGFGVFTLTDADLEITGGVPGLTVTYHETLADAENNVNPLSSPYNNIVVNTQTLYARVESATIVTDCATIVELVLIVNPDPQITLDLTPLEECDDNTDGFTQFDLTQAETEVLNGIDPMLVTVTYYETQANADAGTNAIVVPTSYTNLTNPQTVWIRVEYNATGCYKITSLDLIVNGLPVLTQPSPLELCDVNNPGDEMEAFTLEDSISEILNGQTGISVTFYETQADADAGTNAITSPYVNIANPQTIYARAENDVTGCVSTITLDLRVNPIPTPEPNPTPIEVCDDDNDGFASFDLELRTVEIINGELDISITYHETLAEAESGINPLVSPYDNIVPNLQTVYARAENGLTGCFTVVELDLIVLPSPEVPLDIEDYVICDDDNDGFAQFDLTQMDGVILGAQDPALFTLTYHVTQADADTGNNPIVNVTNYTNVSNPQTIYVHLESVANGCVSTGEFDLVVELPPVPVQPTPLELCDDEVADEITVFDLTVKDPEITGGNASWSVSYYETSADAQADTNAIDPADAYTNTSVGGNPANPQTLFVRVTDTDTGCFAFTTLTIRVLPNPTPSLDPSDLELCDDTNTGDGVEEFDLTVNEAYIINGEAGVSATYHETLEDAEAGINAIATPEAYTNTGSPQTIWVRVTNDITGCYTLVTFNLIVHPLPDVVAVTDFIACEIGTDGFYDFDLTLKDSEVLNGQDPAIFTVTYHETQADAQAGMNALVSPYTNLTNPQQIWVNITNTITGCDIATVSFNIEVQEGAQANSDGQPIVYVLCDDNMETDGDPSNDSTQFDLSSQDAFILDGQDPLNYTVSYYLTLADAELGVNPLPNTYENITNPQMIYARVDNDTTPDSICYAVTSLVLQVDPLPVFDLEDEFTLCVGTNGSEIIDVPVLDTGLSEADYGFQWSLNGVDIPGATGSSLIPTQGGSYTVVVTNLLTGCQNSDTVIINESGPPVVVAEVTTLAFANNHVIEAMATGPGVYEYSLDDGPWQESGTFTDVSAGEHVVRARDINGCGIGIATVLVIDYPHFFTPNGDGYHDTWNIAGIATQPSAKIYIFDRYGKLLKQLSPTGEGWNGTYNGALMPTDDYWFVVEYNEPTNDARKTFRAHFTLKR